MRYGLFGLLTVCLLIGGISAAQAHCEIPCGIYGDEVRFGMIEENIQTIEKSMKEIVQLSEDPGKNANQMVRWVQNKEKHADAIREIVSRYFLAQRIQPIMAAREAEAYHQQLARLHALIVHAMKAKQTTDLEQVSALRKYLKEFHEAYAG